MKPENRTQSLDSHKCDPRTQAGKFADLARELECDESEEAFDERLKKVAKAPPQPPERQD